MLRRFWILAVLCALGVSGALAAEGGAEGKGERTAYRKGWGFRVGYMTADDIARNPIGLPFDTLSDAPRLDSSTLLGAFFYIDGYPWLRLEFRGSVTPTKVLHVCPDVIPDSGDISQRSCIAQEKSVDTKVYQAEALFMPHWRLGRSSFDLGIPFGIGYAVGSAPTRYAPAQIVTSHSGDVELKTSAGMTYFLGLRPIWNLGHGKTIFIEARALRLHRLVNLDARTAKVFEYSAGMSFQIAEKEKKAAAPAEAAAAQPEKKTKNRFRVHVGYFSPTGDYKFAESLPNFDFDADGTVDTFSSAGTAKFQTSFSGGVGYERMWTDLIGIDLGLDYFRPDVELSQTGTVTLSSAPETPTTLSATTKSSTEFMVTTAGVMFHIIRGKTFGVYLGPQLGYVRYGDVTLPFIEPAEDGTLTSASRTISFSNEGVFGAKVGLDVSLGPRWDLNAQLQYIPAKAELDESIQPKPTLDAKPYILTAGATYKF